jgi:hypothetical protein
MSALPSFPAAPNGYDPARVDAFIQRLIDRSRAEIGSLRARNEQLEADLAEAFEVMKAADVRIRTLEMDLERVLEGFAAGKPEEIAHAVETVAIDPIEDADTSTEEAEDPLIEDVEEEQKPSSVPFTEPPPEVNAMEEKAAKAERAIRGRFLSSTKH